MAANWCFNRLEIECGVQRANVRVGFDRIYIPKYMAQMSYGGSQPPIGDRHLCLTDGVRCRWNGWAARRLCIRLAAHQIEVTLTFIEPRPSGVHEIFRVNFDFIQPERFGHDAPEP